MFIQLNDFCTCENSNCWCTNINILPVVTLKDDKHNVINCSLCVVDIDVLHGDTTLYHGQTIEKLLTHTEHNAYCRHFCNNKITPKEIHLHSQ